MAYDISKIVNLGQIKSILESIKTKLNSKEDSSNKVTSLSSSSTDTQYPSAKVVYDTINSPATDSTFGTIKTDSENGVSLDSNGILKVLGRLGQTPQGGLYFPLTSTHDMVGEGSFIVTEGSSMTIGNKSLSVVTGMNITLSPSASAGSTTYKCTRTDFLEKLLSYDANSYIAVALNESKSKEAVVASNVVVDSSANTITITVPTSVNPSSTASSIRVYPVLNGFSNLTFGIAGTGDNYGYSIVGGQGVYNKSNASAVFGNTQINTGNSSLLAGRNHNNSKMNAFLAGNGHNTTSGRDSVAAVGTWSVINSNTAFVVGGGSSNTNRSNLFEVTTAGVAKVAGKTLGLAPTSVTVSLTSTGWANNLQTITVTGVSSDESAQLIQPVPNSSSRSEYESCGVKAVSQAVNSLTFSCDTVPSNNLTVYVVVTPL